MSTHPPTSQKVLRTLQSARFYSPSQHIASPQLFSVISSPSTLTIGSPYIITMKLRHVENPSGNPNSLPVVFDMREFGLTLSERETSKMYNWIILRQRSPGSIEDGRQIEGEEIDLSLSNPTPSEFGFPIFATDSNFELNELQLSVIEKEEEEFISLAVGESRTFKVKWALTEEQEEKMEVGEKYKLCYRGGWNFWWDFGTVEEMEEQEGRRNTSRNQKGGAQRLWIPCTNLVEFEGIEEEEVKVQDKDE
ncbi:hypothetical protein BELL_1007g00040 [Botrytis elliptica]|uniref:Uncharacterized protein n=1 Tax=Botrytis elliptica TaxID=278938 RepID=A0A4Z1IVS3_9HELO|nr:hypothetical protein BELL_1007g00040 [Botrytis elliptica]